MDAPGRPLGAAGSALDHDISWLGPPGRQVDGPVGAVFADGGWLKAHGSLLSGHGNALSCWRLDRRGAGLDKRGVMLDKPGAKLESQDDAIWTPLILK